MTCDLWSVTSVFFLPTPNWSRWWNKLTSDETSWSSLEQIDLPVGWDKITWFRNKLTWRFNPTCNMYALNSEWSADLEEHHQKVWWKHSSARKGKYMDQRNRDTAYETIFLSFSCRQSDLSINRLFIYLYQGLWNIRSQIWSCPKIGQDIVSYKK